MNLHYLRAVGGARKIKKKLMISPDLQKKKKKKTVFLIFLKAYNFSQHYPLPVFTNCICKRLTSVVLRTIA